MFLKTLTLKGFKSFADTTTLELEPGITVVVGPNGSGKSNVVDAVAWVLGAQGPRTLRSSKMDDVIFAGTEKRAALGRAEVILTIDNASGMLPIELSEVTVSRTLFRTGESEYAINGVPCRLLDVQELLSDSGVGRHQHVIVGQGQLDAILTARPEDRRAVIEEAAGVLKFRKRKEKAERRLEATEGNLLRLQDLLREVRRQLRPLERQAEAARRHGELVRELTDLRIHVAGRELASLRAKLEAHGRQRVEQAGAEAAHKAELARLDTGVLAAEARLGALGGDDLGDALVRLERLREKAVGLVAVLTERRRGIERDRRAFVDAAVTATLEADAARLRQDLEQVEAEARALAPDAERLADAERALAAERATFEEGGAPEASEGPGGAAEVRGEIGALRAAIERATVERARIEQRLGALQTKAERLAGELEALHVTQADAVDRLAGEQQARQQAETRLAAATAEADEAEAALRAADAERHAWAARVEALAQAIEEARAGAGAERLEGVEGVLGTLVELVEVEPGWEAAFEAAAGPALAAVVVGTPADARRALEVLVEAGSGAVMPASVPVPQPSDPTPGGAAGTPVRTRVRGRTPEIDTLLDSLLAGAVVAEGDWRAALEMAVARPGTVVVTRAGDRFAPGAWRVGAAGSGATGAALDEARHRAEAAADQLVLAETRLAAARAERDAAAAAERATAGKVDDTARRLHAAEEGIARLTAEQGDCATEGATLGEHRAELDERVAAERDRLTQLEADLPALERAEAAHRDEQQAREAARAALEERAAEVSALRTDLEVRAAAVDERRAYLRQRLAEVDERLAGHAEERSRAQGLQAELDRRLLATDRLAALVTERLALVEAELAEQRERRRRQSEATRETADELDRLRRRRHEVERQLEELRERARRTELEEAEVRLRLEAAVDTLRRELDCEPDRAEAAGCPPLPEGATPAARLRDLERELRLLGPINPLALEEFTSLSERHEFLQGQLDDVKASRRELMKVIRAVDEEIVSVFTAAFADVSENFTLLFDTLFPGGQGRLRLTEPGNPLETGIEVEARPSGKNIRKLSLLSGGERSLTALAFLFAVFRSRPSPFYLLDEVEAALDDVNLHRFLGLLEEFRREAQLLVVSHQKRTMETADCLYGVTMQPGGSSKVVSERMSEPVAG